MSDIEPINYQNFGLCHPIVSSFLLS